MNPAVDRIEPAEAYRNGNVTVGTGGSSYFEVFGAVCVASN